MDGRAGSVAAARPSLLPTSIPDCYLIDSKLHADQRGQFVKVVTPSVLAGSAFELNEGEVFWSTSVRGVLRGLHYQRRPKAVKKIVWCTAGSIHDVVLDLRPGSPTYGRAAGFDLSATNGRGVVVPIGCAHGFLTMTAEATVCYLQSGSFDVDCDSGIRWDGAGIAWPSAGRPVTVSPRDASHPTLEQYMEFHDA